jgi:hypothetical protein
MGQIPSYECGTMSARSTAEKRRQQGKKVWISGVSKSRANLTLFLEGLMPIRIRRRNKNSASVSPPDFWVVMPDTKNFLQASYTAKVTAFGILYGPV